jgi:phthalate 4,5-dioxygenase oxygenase subunit
MLSAEENRLLTRVGRDTPMGKLFRRFWMPALVTSEIAEPDGSPVRLRLLGEDLVAFRGTDGRVGILEAYCPHRRANLFWGRNEECGLRCAYHGWKFDIDGRCVDMPSEPAASRFKDKVRQTSYPTREKGGVIWVYMGPPDKQPAGLPQLEWLAAPDGYQHVTKWLQRTNWAQGMEGEIDTAHISFLHSAQASYAARLVHTAFADPKRTVARKDGSPRLTYQEAPYGFTYGARRSSGEDEYYWRVTRWLYPFFSLIPQVPGAPVAVSGRCWVPIDDEHTWTFSYLAREDRPFGADEIDLITEGAAFPPRLTRGTYTLPDGYVIDTSLPVASKDNDYLIDRDMQRNVNFTGIWGANEQDRAIQESMGAIVDRSREHIGSSDIAIVAARRLLITMARALEAGREPEIVNDPEAYSVRAIDTFSRHDQLADLLAELDATLGAARFS